MTKVKKIVVGKLERKGAFGRLQSMRYYDIYMDLT
jgi:hypothetical protein